MEEDVPPWVGGSGKGLERPDPFGTIPYQFREYVPGDPYKHIEWKKTASTGGLITKVLSDEGAREITIRMPREASERTISRAASLVVHFARSGRPICLQGPGILLGPGRGKEFAVKLLTTLARWENTAGELALPDFSPDIVVEIGQAGEFVWRRSGEPLWPRFLTKLRTGRKSGGRGKSSATTSSVSILPGRYRAFRYFLSHACKPVHRRSLYRKRLTSVSTAESCRW